MRILVAPDKFKEALDASAVADALAAGIRAARPDAAIDLCPLADGGDGSGPLLAQALGAARRESRARDPVGRIRLAPWWITPDAHTAIIEMAQVAGLWLLTPAERDPTRTTSYGVGELMRLALASGARRVLVAVGGSATIDGGAGCLQALGWRALDAGGAAFEDPLTGSDLRGVARIVAPAPPTDAVAADAAPDPAAPAGAAEIIVLTDVSSPLVGPLGAARVFGPQKGATSAQVEQLEAELEHWADVLRRATGRDVRALPGAGAAGGLPAALAAAGATLASGVETIAAAARLDVRLRGCDACVTGEGRLDASSRRGKVVGYVAAAARRAGVPCVAFVGAADPPASASLADFADHFGLQAILAVSPPGPPGAEVLAATATNLRQSAQAWFANA
ncbi:MAG: glycerate kinase [Phycisphaerae bacterium]